MPSSRSGLRKCSTAAACLLRLVLPLSEVLALAAVLFSTAAAQEQQAAETNLERFRVLSARAGARVAGRLGDVDSGTVVLSVMPRETGWIVEPGFARALVQKGMRPVAGGAPRYVAEIGITGMAVRYGDIRRSGLLGAKRTNRDVALSVYAKVTDRRDGRVLLADDLQESAVDTVDISAIEAIESSSVPETRGQAPHEGLFTGVVEPLVTVAAVAVAVYLLFTVRK